MLYVDYMLIISLKQKLLNRVVYGQDMIPSLFSYFTILEKRRPIGRFSLGPAGSLLGFKVTKVFPSVTKVLPTFTKVFPRSLRSFLWVTKVFPFGSPRSSLSLWVTKVFLLGHQGLPFCRQGLPFGPLRSSLWVIKVSPLGHQVLPFGSPRSSITINTNNTVNTINSF